MLNLEVISLSVGQMKANCYLVINKKTRETVIIDPGDDAEYLENIIRDKNAKPVEIICTHGHFDHCGAALELQLAYSIPFAINKNDEFLLDNNRKSAQYYLGLDIGPKPQSKNYLKNNDKINIGKEQLTVVETPGHTPGSICLYSPKENIIFTGDLMFAEGGRGRTDFSYSETGLLLKSIVKIKKLPKDTLAYPGHGEKFFLQNQQLIANS